jgi:YjbE family integral membrane protein
MYSGLGSELCALVTVLVIDLVLAGDNAIVVGMAAAGLPDHLRRKAILFGIATAALLRIILALFATQILDVVGVVLIGGFLLLWVCWKLWRELRVGGHAAEAAAADALAVRGTGLSAASRAKPKTFRQAIAQIVVADVSMSLDNVLAVAGTARHHLWVLVIGLSLSVALMGVAATMIARVLRRFPWISYLGLALIAWVAMTMIWTGAWGAWHATNPHPA